MRHSFVKVDMRGAVAAVLRLSCCCTLLSNLLGHHAHCHGLHHLALALPYQIRLVHVLYPPSLCRDHLSDLCMFAASRSTEPSAAAVVEAGI
jgi:hypothetical protein